MASNHGDQSPTEDVNNTPSPMSEADSGRGLSVADVSSPEGENQHHVSPFNLDLDGEEPRMAIETDTSQDGQGAAAQEPYNRETNLQEGESDDVELYQEDSSDTTTKSVVQPSDKGEGAYALLQSAYNRLDNVVEILYVNPASGRRQRLQLREVSMNRVDREKHGNVSIHVTTSKVQCADETDVLRDFQDLSLSEPVILNYRPSGHVSTRLLQDVKKRGDGKSPHVQEFFNFIAEHLETFGEVEDCYLLLIQEGLLISQRPLTVSNIEGSTVKLAQPTGHGTIVLLNPTVSQDRSRTTYQPQSQTTQGNFTIGNMLGKGVEGRVCDATDIKSRDEFVVKEIPLPKFKEAAATAFLTLSASNDTCRPFGMVLDEEKNRVLFLMEKVPGKTLEKVLKNRTQRMEIWLSVDYTIDILKALQSIHSKGMVHSDVAARNVIIDNLDGRHAILIDLTGAKKGSIFGWDVAGALCLLNGMLRNEIPTTTHLKDPWKASDDDRAKFNEATLQKLEMLLDNQTKLSEVPALQEILPRLQEISRELKGLQGSPDNVDGQVSLAKGGTPNSQGLQKSPDAVKFHELLDEFQNLSTPPNKSISPEVTMEGLKKQIEELTEEKEKDQKEAEKRIKALANLIIQREEELENLAGILKVSRASEKKWKSEVGRLEAEIQEKQDRAEQETKEQQDELDTLKAEAKREREMREEAVQDADKLNEELASLEVDAKKAWDMYDKAEQERKDLSDQLEALKAEMRKGQSLQKTADKDGISRAEEGTERSSHSHPEPIPLGEGC